MTTATNKFSRMLRWSELRDKAGAQGDLRVWWIPQIPGKPFVQHVATLVEAKLLLDMLADYDQFQLDHRIKPDYANAGGLEVFDARDTVDDHLCGEWVDWYDGDTGDWIDDFTLDELRERTK